MDSVEVPRESNDGNNSSVWCVLCGFPHSTHWTHHYFDGRSHLMRDHSLEPLKKHLGGHKCHNNKEVQMALHEWSTLQQLDLYHDGLL